MSDGAKSYLLDICCIDPFLVSFALVEVISDETPLELLFFVYMPLNYIQFAKSLADAQMMHATIGDRLIVQETLMAWIFVKFHVCV